MIRHDIRVVTREHFSECQHRGECDEGGYTSLHTLCTVSRGGMITNLTRDHGHDRHGEEDPGSPRETVKGLHGHRGSAHGECSGH